MPDLTEICVCTNDYTGKYCDTKQSLCDLAIPCYNGGNCDRTINICRCYANFTGNQCETYTIREPASKVVKIKNKGFYVAKAEISYVSNGVLQVQSKSISAPNSQTFILPYTAQNILLTVNAVAGKQVFSLPITNEQECFHVWGTTFVTRYSTIACW